MRTAVLAAVALALTLGGAVAASPDHPRAAVSAPYVALRALQNLQEQLTRGSAAAQSAQPRVMGDVEAAFAAADPAAWSDSRNAQAAALYLFSAGRPAVVQSLLDRGTVSPENLRLLKGALAYAAGQDDVAREILGGFDPRALPPGLGGHLALVMATLYADKDPARAGRMLDTARLLVPGTLVEEAALRRQIFLLGAPASLDKFAALSRQYVRRFHGSVFAANFKARLVSVARQLALAGDVGGLTKLDTVLAGLSPAEGRGVELALARDALVAGHPDAARHAADTVSAMAPDAADTIRIDLYRAAALAPSVEAPSARAALRALDAGRLSAEDADLRTAALAVAASVDAETKDRTAPAADAGRVSPDGAAEALVSRGKSALTSADDLLGSGK